MPLELSLGPDVAGRVQLGLGVLDGVAVRPAAPALDEEIAGLVAELRSRHAGRAPSEVPGVAEARALYRALGLDPTKTRPSSEALLRRVLRGDALYRVSTLVDAVNLVSLRRQLPYGLYDLARVEPPVVLRLGRDGEGYEGIRKGTVHLAGRPVLADARGAFGNPSSDSARTAIRSATTRALVIAYAPAGYPARDLVAALEDALATAARHCGGSAGERRLLPADGAPDGWR